MRTTITLEALFQRAFHRRSESQNARSNNDYEDGQPVHGHLITCSRNSTSKDAKQRRSTRSCQRGPAHIDQSKNAIKRTPERGSGAESHDSTVYRFTCVEGVAGGFEIKKDLQNDGDCGDPEDRSPILNCGCWTHEPFPTPDGSGEQNSARPHHPEEIAWSERGRLRKRVTLPSVDPRQGQLLIRIAPSPRALEL